MIDMILTLFRAQWDRLVGLVLVAAGSLGLVVGGLAALSSSTTADKLSFVASGVIGGCFCAGVGGTLLLSARLQDKWRILHSSQAANAQTTEELDLTKGTVLAGSKA